MSTDEGGRSPVSQVADALKDMKKLAEMTYRDISDKTGFCVTTLTEACRGERLPSWAVTHAFVRACHGDEGVVRELYARACAADGREPPGAAVVELPDPAQARTAPEVVDYMRQVRLWAGNPSLDRLNVKSGGYLPPSTLSGVLRRRTLPRLKLLVDFLRACDVTDDKIGAAEIAWRAIKAAGDAPG